MISTAYRQGHFVNENKNTFYFTRFIHQLTDAYFLLMQAGCGTRPFIDLGRKKTFDRSVDIIIENLVSRSGYKRQKIYIEMKWLRTI